MNKMVLVLVSAFLSVSTAFAGDMTCLVGVYKTSDMLTDKDAEKAFIPATVPLVKGEGEKEFVVNGENVAVSLYKREFADVYDAYISLQTPVADRRNGAGFVTALMDNLVNAGPAKDNGWTPNYKEGATLFTYIRNEGGTIAITLKLQKALEAGGFWGQYPYTSWNLSVSNSYDLANTVRVLSKKKLLKKDDVLALSTVFDCTLNK